MGEGGLPTYRGHRRADRDRVGLMAVSAALVVAAALVVFAVAFPGGGNDGKRGLVNTGAMPTSTASFAPISIEAEAPSNTLTGSATPIEYPGASGGRVVRFIGDVGSPLGPGALRFNGITVPAGGWYGLTFQYVNANIAQTTQSIDITASGAGTRAVTVAGGQICCSSQVVMVFLVAGTNAITFSNPKAPAPAIDKITIDLR